jgi:hypothetical protein
MKHTKEPWSVRGGVEHLEDGPDEYVAEIEPAPCATFRGDVCRIQSAVCISGIGHEESAANANRIVTCVNAMAGIEDPQAFVESHAAMLEALGALKAILGLSETTSPFGGEMQQDRIDRTVERAEAAIAKAEAIQ